jgi:hypothetical protein
MTKQKGQTFIFRSGSPEVWLVAISNSQTILRSSRFKNRDQTIFLPHALTALYPWLLCITATAALAIATAITLTIRVAHGHTATRYRPRDPWRFHTAALDRCHHLHAAPPTLSHVDAC